MSRIALVGNLTVDRIAGGPPRAGGGVFHGARAAVHVGAEAVVATRCAPADREVALAPLEALGLPVVCADASETTAFSFHYEGDHRVMVVDAVGDDWARDDVDGWAAAALGDAEWVHVAGCCDRTSRQTSSSASPTDGSCCSTRRASCAARASARCSATTRSIGRCSST